MSRQPPARTQRYQPRSDARRPLEGFWVELRRGRAGFNEPAWFRQLDAYKRWRAIEDIARLIEDLRLADLVETAYDKLREYPESTDEELEELLLDVYDSSHFAVPLNLERVLRGGRELFEQRHPRPSQTALPGPPPEERP